MGGSSVSDDWEFITNGAWKLLLIGCTGGGRSATGNSILGRKAFRLMSSFGGVTKTCEIQRTRLEDGQILDVIDTPGFNFRDESELVGNEIVKCVDLADDGVQAVLFVLSVRTTFSKEEQEVLKMCGNRQVLFDNKTKDPMKKAKQLREHLFHVNMAKMKLHNDTLDVNSFLGDLKQEVTELKKQLQRWSFEDQHRQITEMVESELNNTMHILDKQLEEERTARLEAEKNAESKIRELNFGRSRTSVERRRSYSCYKCRSHARKGRGFLFAHVKNIVVGTKEEKHLTTGLHTIADIYCSNCNEVLGWKYQHAVQPSQKYKKGNSYSRSPKLLKLIGSS
ncbi:unnamed protein product [Withania somnifera]